MLRLAAMATTAETGEAAHEIQGLSTKSVIHAQVWTSVDDKHASATLCQGHRSHASAGSRSHNDGVPWAVDEIRSAAHGHNKAKKIPLRGSKVNQIWWRGEI